MFSFLKKKKKEETPPPPLPPPAAGAEAPPAPKVTQLEIHIFPSEHEIWSQFAVEVKGNETENENEFVPDYTVPGDLAYELAGLCEREGAIELDAEKIMYFSEATNYLLLLKKNGKNIGFLLLALYPGPSQAKIWLVCVSSAESGKQYSKVLIDQAKRMAKEAEKSTIHLEALSRKVGRKVYKAQGFNFNESDGENMTAELNEPKKRKTRKNLQRRK